MLTVTVKSDDAADREWREAAAGRVIAEFGNRVPAVKLLCFFDDEDCELLKEDIVGKANRGFYLPVLGGKVWQYLPEYVRACVFPLFGTGAAFDELIYLHGSTCASEAGLTMTFAHELQHFVQHGNALGFWAANSVVGHLPKSVIGDLKLRWCDIPHEREARIVSKRIGETLLGEDIIRQYIEMKISELVTEEDASDWEYVRGIDTSILYDLVEETKRFFPRLKVYRPELESLLQEMKNEPKFKDLDTYLNLGSLLDG